MNSSNTIEETTINEDILAAFMGDDREALYKQYEVR